MSRRCATAVCSVAWMRNLFPIVWTSTGSSVSTPPSAQPPAHDDALLLNFLALASKFSPGEQNRLAKKVFGDAKTVKSVLNHEHEAAKLARHWRAPRWLSRANSTRCPKDCHRSGGFVAH